MKYRNIVVGCIILLVISFFIFKYFTKEITPNIVPSREDKYEIGKLTFDRIGSFNDNNESQIIFSNELIQDMVSAAKKYCINRKGEVPLMLILMDGKKEIYRGEVTYEKNAKREAKRED